MLRCANFASFFVLVLLFWAVAGTIRQNSSLSAQPEARLAPPTGESPRDHLRRKDAGLKFLPTQPAAKKPDGESDPADAIGSENREATVDLPPAEAAPEIPVTQKEDPMEKNLAQAEDAVHFLLIGRWPQSQAATVLMVVTLIPEECALLTAIDPLIEVVSRGKCYPLGELLARDPDRNSLYRAVTGLSGLKPQFYIELDLNGFLRMTALLDDERPHGTPAAAARGDPSGGGRELLALISDSQARNAEKERLLIDYLLAASQISSTRLGLKLLWLGYHSLATDLSLGDLLQLRTVSEKISPLEVSFSSITEASHQ